MTTPTSSATTTVVLPALGENVTEGTITRWLKEPGDRVEQDEPLLEVATDKVDTEIPAPIAGILVDVLAPEDAVVEIGARLATINPRTEMTDLADEPSAATDLPEPAPPAPPTNPPPPAESAAERSVADKTVRLPRIRQTIARRMLDSLHTSAQLTTVVETDVTHVARLRAQHKDDFYRRTGVKLSFLPFFVAAAVDAIVEHPIINASVNADHTEVTYHAAVHLGIAVDSAKGLMVPVMRNANDLDLTQLAQAIAAAAESVRSGTVRPDDLTGGTFTITNTGSRGALFDTPIINQPQSAILGIGTVVERVVPDRGGDGEMRIAVRSMAHLSLTYDHRIVDGADAARYLTAVTNRLDENGFGAADLL